MLLLATGPLSAQTVPQTSRLDASTPSLTQPCSSARAVHDVRCANYTGFKARVSAAREPAQAPVSDAQAPSPGERVAQLQPRAGRDIQRGVASWYGPGFHGRLTANGERFNENDLTAAHKTLPFGTRVLVKNPRNGKQVVVRINDRGPFVRGRVIDVSRAAARQLGMKQSGHLPVVLHEVRPGDDIVASAGE